MEGMRSTKNITDEAPAMCIKLPNLGSPATLLKTFNLLFKQFTCKMYPAFYGAQRLA